MTGLYMRGQEAKQQDDGYTLDFTALENGKEEKLSQIGAEQAQNNNADRPAGGNMENDLDYMPLEEDLSAEVGSRLVEIPGLTDSKLENAPKDVKKSEESDSEDNSREAETDQKEEAESKQTSVELHYNEEQGLTKPVNGEILLPYSMDGSIYFATLDQYKYNPATVFAADEGTDVVACAEGRIADVYADAELGNTVTLELGDGYRVTYGQLADIQVEKDGYVKAGEKLGTVAAPSKYYSLEGTNLYFRMEKDGTPVNAENLF